MWLTCSCGASPADNIIRDNVIVNTLAPGILLYDDYQVIAQLYPPAPDCELITSSGDNRKAPTW